MAEPSSRLMTPEEFFEWQRDQDERYELVDGAPRPLRAMTGASNAHDVIVVNCIIQIGNRLEGMPCRVSTADTAVRTKIRTLRRPDVTVECAPPERKSYEALEPRVVVEALSPSTSKFDRFTKLDEYRRHPTIRHVLLIDPDMIAAKLYSRPREGESGDVELLGRDAVIELSEIDVSLPLGTLYARLSFE
ncbi:MAG: Uma2 family endonuclease [Hyphomicrobiales bacterium]